MRTYWPLISLVLGVFILTDCASETANYSLPSSNTAEKPDWVGSHRSARDTIFIVINIPRTAGDAVSNHVQTAQSELHNILSTEIELLLRDYWEENQLISSEDEKFQLLSELPRTLEQIMNHVTVSDGWNNAQTASFLCALDYEEVAELLMLDMGLDDRSFLSYFKRRMDGLAQEHP